MGKRLLCLAAATVGLLGSAADAFLSPQSLINPDATASSSTRLHDVQIMNDGGGTPDAPRSPEEDAALQWDLFTKHHAKDGEWWGTWTTYDYLGDVKDSTIAAVSLQPDAELTSVTHTHKILTSSTTSDCETCFDSSQVTALPTIATYTPETLGKRHRLGAVGMVVGPSLLPKSGIMSTELTLKHGDGRVRVTFQHAPVWERGIEPGSCPPQGLKLFRAMVSKEKLRPTIPEDDSSREGKFQGPPTADEEKSNPPAPGNPKFFRPVPPFKWHAKWAGTSWTWGPTTGDRGWAIQEVDDADAWHGRPMGDSGQQWSMRLPGGVMIQCPKLVVGGIAGLCRVAWMPEDEGEVGTIEDGNRAKLLRLEASVMALEPIISDEDENMMVGFYPPSLGSLRCDVLEKVGELEGASLEERERAAEGFVWSSGGEEIAKASSNGEVVTGSVLAQGEAQVAKKSPDDDEELTKKIAADPRNALDF